jgi:hypothetical protein
LIILKVTLVLVQTRPRWTCYQTYEGVARRDDVLCSSSIHALYERNCWPHWVGIREGIHHELWNKDRSTKVSRLIYRCCIGLERDVTRKGIADGKAAMWIGVGWRIWVEELGYDERLLLLLPDRYFSVTGGLSRIAHRLSRGLSCLVLPRRHWLFSGLTERMVRVLDIRLREFRSMLQTAIPSSSSGGGIYPC